MSASKAGWVTLQYLVLFAFWVVLSGRFEIKYLVMGAIASGLVTFLTMDLLVPEGEASERAEHSWRWLALSAGRFFLYHIWLLFSIVKANLQIAYVVLHPKMPIQPGLLRFNTRLNNNFGHILLANSITLTPGTITIDLREGTYFVHALVPEAAESLLQAQMQSKLEAIFGEPEEPQPEICWVDDVEGKDP